MPHSDNISYFGDGYNEAQMVYNFALPPLTLHALRTGDARVLSEWAAGLTLPSEQTTFFNFLASHDGIGLNPARGILPEAEIAAVVAGVEAHGGLVAYKNNPDGSRSPYELNISYFDALSDPHGTEPLATQVDRFMASQAILLAMIGVPGIYFHSLFGSRGWPEGVAQTGRNRTINRQKLDLAELEAELADPASLRAQVFSRYTALLAARAASLAFHPNGGQRVISCADAVFALLRSVPGGGEAVLCLQNVANQTEVVPGIATVLGPDGWCDLITGHSRGAGPDGLIELKPYETLWLTKE